MASSSAAAARGDAAQAVFERTTAHDRREIPDLRAQGIVYCSLVWTADGRPHQSHEPWSMQQTSRRAAVVQQISTTSLQHRWKHEVQVALLRRRAAMTRAVLPNTSVKEQWLLAGVIDRATSHGIRAPPLVGREDEDTDIGTYTAVPDADHDDIASFISQQTTAIDTPNLGPLHTRLLGGRQPFTLLHEQYAQHSFLRAPPTVSEVANRLAQLPRALTVAYALRDGTCEFLLQVSDLASDAVTAICPQNSSLWWQASASTEVPSRITQLPGAFRALLAREPHGVPALHEEQDVHQEFFLLQLWYELAMLMTPSEWIENCQLRCTQRRRQQRSPLHQEGEDTVTAALTFVTHRLDQPRLFSGASPTLSNFFVVPTV